MIRRAALLVPLLLVACSAPGEPTAPAGDVAAPAGRAGYPVHWWAEVPRAEAKSWEILPQDAGPGEVILSKRHELGLLSNFAATPFTFRGRRYASLEGYWQHMKYPEGPQDPRAAPGREWKLTREQVAGLTAFEAHAAGDAAEEHMRALGIEWISFEGERIEYRGAGQARHLELIEAASWEKLRQNPDVRRALLATGDLALQPDHHQKPDSPPAWRYYEIWMRIRAALRRGEEPGPQ